MIQERFEGRVSFTMDLIGIVFFLVLLFINADGSVNHKGTRDYCLLDKFNPECKDNEVIIINSAKFGRMKNNPCISREIGRTGCFSDVKDILDTLCAGRVSCSIMTSDQVLLATRPCGGNFNLYLTASYSCLKVHTDNEKSCAGQNAKVIKSESGYFASTFKEENKQNQRCPWKIKSTSGRQFNVTIQKFPSGANNKGSNPPVCHSAATIKEKSATKNILLCPSDAVNKSVYLSESDEIEFTFTNDGSNKDVVFLMHYQGVGCPNPVVPKDTHFKRSRNRASVICNESETSWELNCKDNEWLGEEKDCAVGWAFASAMGQDEAPRLGMLLIIVTGIALGVLIGGFLLYLAINAFKRYHGLLPAQQIQNPSYEKPFYNPNKMAYNDRTIQRSSMIYGTNRRSYPNRQMPPPVPPPHADNAQMRPPSEISEANRQSHIYETPLFNSL